MTTALTKAFGIGLAALLLTAGAAAQHQSATVEYSADTSLEHAEGAMKGKVYSAPGKERREMKAGAETVVSIMRTDKKITWMLMPEQKMYMEMKQNAAAPGKDDLSAYKIEQTVVGKETMNGVETTKSKIIMTGQDGSKMGGFMWMSKDNIMVKMDAVAIDKGSKNRFKSELTNIKIGKQDPALFEIPPGYQKMSMPGMDMGNMGNMKDMRK